jgi:GNAT superfamily N-acetyltransferase
MEAHASGTIQVVEEPWSALAQHATIPIAFIVESVFEVSERHSGGFDLVERRLDRPYLKDYDAIESPTTWAARFDVSTWGLIGAYRDGARIGGAAIAFDTASVELLEGRPDLALLWDLRVHPDMRRQDAARALFAAGTEWARSKGCNELKVETQNINVPACRFYAKQRCELRRINRNAYPSLPDEIQLLWYKNLR